ncbi:MAG: hypothetical protein WC958_02200 [Dehalococcoidales bacterium]
MDRNEQDILATKRLELESSLSDRKVTLADTKIVKSYIEDLRALLDSGEMTERRAFIASFVKSATIKREEAHIEYTIPIPKGEVNMKNTVLPTVHYGGR